MIQYKLPKLDYSVVNYRRREILLIILNVFFSKEVHSLFPYWVNRRKFNWNNLRNKFENMANWNLKEIILKINEMLISND